MDVMVRPFCFDAAVGYKYNISINEKVDVFLNNRKVTVKLLKLLGENARLYSTVKLGISNEYRRWRET